MQLPDTHPSTESLLAICLFAAFADGEKSDAERARIEALADELGGGDVAAVSRRILMGRLSLNAAVAGLNTREERMLAYEMARAVCESGGSISADEQAFLNELRSKLALGETDAKTLDAEVDGMALAPVESAVPAENSPDHSGMILRYSILNGAEIKALYTPMVNEARQLHAKYLPDIQQRAQTLDTASVLNLVRGNTPV